LRIKVNIVRIVKRILYLMPLQFVYSIWCALQFPLKCTFGQEYVSNAH